MSFKCRNPAMPPDESVQSNPDACSGQNHHPSSETSVADDESIIGKHLDWWQGGDNLMISSSKLASLQKPTILVLQLFNMHFF